MAADAQVVIDNFTFSPTPLKVTVGTTVTWVNHDDIPHSIVCPALKVHSHPLDTDDSFATGSSGRAHMTMSAGCIHTCMDRWWCRRSMQPPQTCMKLLALKVQGVEPSVVIIPRSVPPPVKDPLLL